MKSSCTIDLLKDLIKIPSYVDGSQNEKRAAIYIESFFQKLGDKFAVEKQLVEKDRVNLIVHDNTPPKIILFGHMDTVLPKKETLNPFKPRIDGNKLYGLGSVDMKAGLAIMLNQATKNYQKGLAFIFTSDEEYEFKGALKLIEKYRFKPQIIINLEPTNLEMCNGCRGITEFSFVVNGKSVHASRKHLGINAIEKAVDLTNELQKRLKKFDGKDNIKNSLNLAFLHGGVLQEVDKMGEKKISGLGMIVPNYAQVNCEIRVANSELKPQIIKREIVDIGESIGVKVSDISFKFYLGSMSTPKKNLQSFEDAIQKSNVALKYRDISLAGYFEVQLLKKKWACDCVIFGPGPNEASHAANEYVDIDSISKAEKVIEAYIRNNL